MKLSPTSLYGAFLVESALWRDRRGSFMEVYREDALSEAGIRTSFVQDNFSHSVPKGVIRGLHFQREPWAQAKLVWVVTGRVYDVVVDIRPDSPTYLMWEAFELSGDRPVMIFIPKGFAHGFCTLEEDTRVFYKVDAPYRPDAESGIRWNDPGLAIDWPVASPIVSDKDACLPLLSELGMVRTGREPS